MRTSAKILGALLGALLAASSLIWYAALRENHRGILQVTFLNVGQDDAILIQTPSERTALVDGGSDDEILRQLGSILPFYDRSLDLVIATAPEPQTVGGLASVLARFRVGAIVRSAAHSSAPQAEAFDAAIANAQQSGARLIVARRGQVIDLGAGAYIEFLFPDRDASSFAPSDGCLAFKLALGATSFLFACGSSGIESYLATLDGSKLQTNVLAATDNDSELFVGFASPQFAVVPCGSSATTSALAKLDIQTFDTCSGAMTFVSDGQTVSPE